VLQEGASRVCTRSGSQCVELTEPGETAIITATGAKITIQKTGNSPWNFAAACAAAAGLCNVTDYADATPTITPTIDPSLCGR
jgi:hypothetical protein